MQSINFVHGSFWFDIEYALNKSVAYFTACLNKLIVLIKVAVENNPVARVIFLVQFNQLKIVDNLESCTEKAL